MAEKLKFIESVIDSCRAELLHAGVTQIKLVIPLTKLREANEAKIDIIHTWALEMKKVMLQYHFTRISVPQSVWAQYAAAGIKDMDEQLALKQYASEMKKLWANRPVLLRKNSKLKDATSEQPKRTRNKWTGGADPSATGATGAGTTEGFGATSTGTD